MKRCFVGVFLLAMVLGAVHAQSQSPEWTIEKVSGNFEDTFGGLLGGHGGGQGGIAKWRIQGRTLEQVWTAIMQSLMFIKRTTATGDLPSGTITANRPGALIHFVLAQREPDVELIGKWEFVPGEKVQLSTPFSQAKKFFNELFPKVKDALK